MAQDEEDRVGQIEKMGKRKLKQLLRKAKAQRRAEERARNRNPNLSREQYLGIKRRQLHERMRRRRASKRASAGASARRTRVRLF